MQLADIVSVAKIKMILTLRAARKFRAQAYDGLCIYQATNGNARSRWN